ncbi:t-SNARE [Syncephalis pseudoplumigaleata]|uniref:t-SNARE n=1 Tax=Syncephalis pseudoplumigaleata TaxID=1712513 RepID=A0A4P9YUP4_9FUNG|nr:t-SNARE [Syncephalis pseudoplumigaleata]|eukprot:RKP23697.1 t-SNARE [Syncephalis pseudoplumigaleata]
MTTRSRTLLFLQYRSSYTRSHLSRAPTLVGDSTERAGLIQHAADMDDRPGGDGSTVIEMSVLPPQWVDTMENIDEDMDRLRQSIKRLDELHQKQLLPGLDEGLRFERDIERLQAEITSQFRQCQQRIKHIGGNVRSPGTHGLPSNEEDRLGRNVQVALATRLQELSSMFRRKQSSFLQSSKGRRARRDCYSRGAFTKEQLVLVEDTEAVVAQRDREIREITRSISELAEIFQDLQTMVIDQGTLLDRIDYNIEQVNASTRGAVEELTKVGGMQRGMLSIAYRPSLLTVDAGRTSI